MKKNNGYYKVGTLKPIAEAITKTYLYMYDYEGLRKRASKEASTDPALRWGWFMTQMLTDFDDFTQNELSPYFCESCWVEPEAYEYEEVMDLVPVYTKELCDEDTYNCFHPDILKMFHSELESRIIDAALEGHYDYLYGDEEGPNAPIQLPNGIKMYI